MVTFNKRPQAPASLATEKLKAAGSYREEDVMTALNEDFHGKCYICEFKYPPSLNVEHFDEHRDDKDKKFDWNNLYNACNHCNSTKNDLFRNRPSDLLNCTNASHQVDLCIEYRLIDDSLLRTKADIKQNLSVVMTPYQDKVDNTLQLLNAVYNGTGSPLRNQEAYNLLQHVTLEINQFMQMLIDYQTTSNPTDRATLKAKLTESLPMPLPSPPSSDGSYATTILPPTFFNINRLFNRIIIKLRRYN